MVTVLGVNRPLRKSFLWVHVIDELWDMYTQRGGCTALSRLQSHYNSVFNSPSRRWSDTFSNLSVCPTGSAKTDAVFNLHPIYATQTLNTWDHSVILKATAQAKIGLYCKQHKCNRTLRLVCAIVSLKVTCYATLLLVNTLCFVRNVVIVQVQKVSLLCYCTLTALTIVGVIYWSPRRAQSQ